MKGAIAKAEELLKTIPNAFMPQQFDNPANPEVHHQTTAEEIWRDTDGRADIIAVSVGTGGTITGVGSVLKNRKPQFRCIADKPAKSPVITQTKRHQELKPAPHKLQGLVRSERASVNSSPRLHPHAHVEQHMLAGFVEATDFGHLSGCFRRIDRSVGEPPCARRCRRTDARKAATRPRRIKSFKLPSQG
jgi:hypothetical protein